MINKIDLESVDLENSQEININNIFKKLKRNIKFILSVTILSSIFSVFYASSQKPIYKGQFQILVRDEDELKSGGAVSAGTALPKGFTVTNTFRQTQGLILTSPMVLNPIYEFAKIEYKRRNDDISKLSYNKWFKKNISFSFVENSEVFELTFKDRDKSFILSILNKISEEYKKYSKKDYNKNLNRELDYLKKQEIIYKEKYEESFKKNNEFVIKNNLYVTDNNLESNLDNSKLENINQNKNRYFEQFSKLDEYELKRALYSTRLKPNSEYLKRLDFQISRLKKITKKPTMILLKKEFLYKSMIRDERTLENIKNKIIKTKLALAKQKDPWELISTPTVDEIKISPNKKNIVFTFFFLSFFISSVLSLLKEVFIGSIDDIELIKSIFKANFVSKIPLNVSEINAKLLELNVEKIFSEKKDKESKNIGIYFQNNNQLISDYIDRNKNLSYLNNLDFNKFKDISNILIFLESGKVTYDQINRINKYVDLYQEKKFYWIYTENEKII